MKKININDDELIKIYNEYKSGVSIRKLEKKYEYSFSFLQKKIKSINNDKIFQYNYPDKDNHVIVAICKKTNKKFYDYKNISGSITSHIKNLYNLKISSKYKRKNIEYETGKFWYDEYFNFEYEQIKQTIKCDYCDWTTTDIDNLSGAYEKHLHNVHNISINKHIHNYPEQKKYFKKDTHEKLIKCEVCGKELKYITNTHLNKHNLTQLDYKLKYTNNIICDQTKNKLISNYNLYLKDKSYNNTSSIENFIINNIPIKFEQSNRLILNGKEIDLIYNNIGIEINGLIYHTELFGNKDYKYHLNKTIEANNKNILLYHIFEDEIMNNPSIVLNKIKHILNINNNLTKIHARKCVITTEITQSEKSTFLNNNHIQGNDKSMISIVARYDNNIVAIMTFDNKRSMNKSCDNNTYELTRFVVKNDLIISGIGSRLLKHFIMKYKPKKIISFADRRWTPDSENNLYVKLGFKLTKTLRPDYWYYNPKIHRSKRFHKFGFGKKSIKKRFPEVYDENKTEWQMMQELGFDRIWDCGKFKYELDF